MGNVLVATCCCVMQGCDGGQDCISFTGRLYNWRVKLDLFVSQIIELFMRMDAGLACAACACTHFVWLRYRQIKKREESYRDDSF